MPDECQKCGRKYAVYGEGHEPNSQACLENQASDLEKKVIILEGALKMIKKIAQSHKHKDPLGDIECEVNRAYRLVGHNEKVQI